MGRRDAGYVMRERKLNRRETQRDAEKKKELAAKGRKERRKENRRDAEGAEKRREDK
jgi:hypothetical protein